MRIILEGERFLLLKERAAIWEDQKTLLIADLHIGKVSHFRKNGIQVPAMAEKNNLWRLADIMLSHTPQKVIFLGDLFHSKLNTSWADLVDFLEGFPNVEFILVKGNHDILPEQTFIDAGLKVVEQLEMDPFLFTHDATESDLYNIHGHIHPGVRLSGIGRQRLSLPCFYFGEGTGIFPSFGDFTGLYKIKPIKTDRVFVSTDEEVVQVF
ncbi:ligase-associated DNA damage response endonuclease PdeM [Cryomorpha ignava]|uniref:Ligase-associated DNA damage response endonuclease PdeM n=1 Tax=Cryomorpha ignava TaxID=101383 RepID=A0A7K3WW18_9FLAO|nr:ligase-associated DNA damage response endonuclease PdeM [Cryomorpha ignava]NEN24795.1 ligase-associated DNA damage response endonuclease PdeM [Cryomorpha ignava]